MSVCHCTGNCRACKSSWAFGSNDETKGLFMQGMPSWSADAPFNYSVEDQSGTWQSQSVTTQRPKRRIAALRVHRIYRLKQKA